MKKNVLIITGVVLIIIIGWWWYAQKMNVENLTSSDVPTPRILSFSDCLNARYPILESYPRQCKTPDGRIFAEELPTSKPVYINATSGVVSVVTPSPDSVTGKEFEVRGVARGWYFEGSFPVIVRDANNNVLTTSPAQAQSDWMTSQPVSFIAKIKIPNNYIGKATVILKKDNPSGLPEYDASMSFPINIEY